MITFRAERKNNEVHNLLLSCFAWTPRMRRRCQAPELPEWDHAQEVREGGGRQVYPRRGGLLLCGKQCLLLPVQQRMEPWHSNFSNTGWLTFAIRTKRTSNLALPLPRRPAWKFFAPGGIMTRTSLMSQMDCPNMAMKEPVTPRLSFSDSLMVPLLLTSRPSTRSWTLPRRLALSFLSRSRTTGPTMEVWMCILWI